MTKKKLELEKAEQQIFGFYHHYEGGNLEQLCSAMGLTKKEYEEMISEGMLDYLPGELGKEIVEYLNEN